MGDPPRACPPSPASGSPPKNFAADARLAEGPSWHALRSESRYAMGRGPSRHVGSPKGNMERLITIKAAAAALSVSVRFLERLVARGELQVVRLGRAIRISERELERLCNELQK
jgi:excisionase family DNA binding protein